MISRLLLPGFASGAPRQVYLRAKIPVYPGQITYNARLASRLPPLPYVHDGEPGMVRFHNGRFALSREHADWARLRKRGCIKGRESSPQHGLGRHDQPSRSRDGSIVWSPC
jgi:hypothetical protein